MHRTIGAALLIAGTCIGSGMIALPLVLAKLGLIPSILLMVAIWFIMYISSLINLELNLQAGTGMPLGELGKKFAGPLGGMLGQVLLKLLSYSLLAVYIYGGSSIIQEFLASKLGAHYSLEVIAFIYTAVSMGVLLLPIRVIDYFNRTLFIGLLAIVGAMILGLFYSLDSSRLPLVSTRYSEFSVWAGVVPVMFTSFGFQVIFHTLTNYCHKDAKMLKQAFFWGSLLPAFVYISWTCSVLGVVYQDNPAFYQQLVDGKGDVGVLIQALSNISHWESVRLLTWGISFLAIGTSVLGVGVGLLDAIKGMLGSKISRKGASNILSVLLTLGPAYLAVVFVPNAFIAILGFAGMILSLIAILLPVYIYSKINTAHLHYQELRHRWIIVLCCLVALVVIACELFNML